MYMIKEKVSEGLSRLFADSPNPPPSAAAASSSSSSLTFAESKSDPSKTRLNPPEGKSISSYFSYIGFGPKKEVQDPKPYQSLPVAPSDADLKKQDTGDSCGGNSPSYKSYETPRCNQCNPVLEVRNSVGNKEEEEDTGSGKSTSSSEVFEEASEQHSPANPLRNLMDDSVFISPELYEFLNSCLPNLVKGRQWVLLYRAVRQNMVYHYVHLFARALRFLVLVC